MGVRKFRSIEEMSAWQETRHSESTVASFDRLLRHCQRFLALRPRRFEPRVEKFRSIEEAQAARLAAGEART
jgi:hypothetical protein